MVPPRLLYLKFRFCLSFILPAFIGAAWILPVESAAFPARDTDVKSVAEGTSLTLPKDTFLTGEPVTLDFMAPPDIARSARITGELAPGTDHSNAEQAADFFAIHFAKGYYDLEGKTSGKIQFDAPYWQGSYVIRLVENGKELASVSFQVVLPEGAGFQLERRRFRPGERGSWENASCRFRPF